MNTHFFLGFLIFTTASQGWAEAAAAPTKEQLDFFEQKIRPILADNCYKCHSEEKGKAKGGLTLDLRMGWEKGGESGAAVVPGNLEKSLLYSAVTYGNEDTQMPPTSSGGKLAESQISDLAAWIKMGAPDPRTEAKKAKLSGLSDKARSHWAYQPVKKPAVPINKNQQWCRTPVDCFILQKLEAKTMFPSPDADRETLLRRVTYDFTGLPATYAEVEAFMADTAPNAYSKVLDRLLASPAYGERWGRHWLDTARYSDTIGGDRNNRTTEYRYPDAWTYRDYVVKAFNDDKPYTDFITEQLAADKLPGVQPNDARLAALGFLTVGERFRNVNDVINDRIDVTSKGFLGLTVACARCHDHMFDPIPTKDYYALHGVFTNITEPADKPLIGKKPDPQQERDFTAKMAVATKELQTRYYDAVGFYLNEFRAKPAAYIQAALAGGGGKRDAEAILKRNEIIKKNSLDEQFVQFIGRGFQRNPGVWRPLMQFRNGGSYKPGVAMAGMDPEKRMERMEAKLGEKMGAKAEKMARQLANRAKVSANHLIEEALAARQPKNFDEALQVYVDLFASLDAKAKDFIPSMKNAVSQTIAGYEDEALVQLLSGPFEVTPAPLATKDWIETAQLGWPNKVSGRARLNFGDINMLEISHPGAPARAMVVQDKNKVANSAVFIRGQAETKGEIVPRGFLEILSPAHQAVHFSQGSGRLELAQCIASKDNPLTARVIVNRVWMHHFGEGFVQTPDDLGVMSEKPTHPELLDYLASYFMENGWSLKKLHKLIAMSRVYQESSQTRKEYEVVDPENRLLWRANIRRLDFEAMRDSLLVFSGQLDRTLGGKPINLTEEPYSYRRSAYGYVDRGNLPELMASFDFSDPDMPNSRRTTTVVPQQALFLMNSSMAVDVARKTLARPEVARASTDLHRIMALYRIIFQRTAKPQEIQMGVQFIQNETSVQDEIVASMQGKLTRIAEKEKRLAKGGKKNNEARFGAIHNEGDRVERKPLSPWETYAQALLFSNEAAYVN